MERVILGDDDIFGTELMSEARARQVLARFRDSRDIMELLEGAQALGVHTFMCTTHDRLGDVCDRVRAQPSRYRELVFHPCLPYPPKYAQSVSEVGLLETLKRFSTGGLVSTLFRGALGALTQDVLELMKLLVDAELKRFERLRVPVVFLHSAVTDLLLGLQLADVLAQFHRYVRARHQAEAGFITLNMPALVGALARVGVDNPVVCATINSAGHRMAGGREAYEKTLRERRFRPVARGVLSSENADLESALAYVCQQTPIESIVVSALSPSALATTKAHIERLDARRPAS